MNRISTRQRFLFEMLLILLFVANVSLAQPPILAQPSKEDQSRIQRLTEIAIAEYERIVAKIPFGSEWEVTLTGEERSWANEQDWQFDDRVSVNAKGNLQIPSVKLCICDIIMWIKIILTNISDPREQEEAESSFFDFMLPPDWLEQKIRFQGSAEWTAGRYFSKTGDGKHDVSIEYDPCPPCVKRIACTEYIIIDVNGFFFRDVTGALWDPEVVGSDPPKRKGIKKEIRSNWTRRIEDDCPGYQAGVPVLVHDKSLKTFSFREGTVRVIEQIESESASLKNSYHIDMNLRQVCPRDPIESLLSPVNISRITPSWSPNNTLSTGEIKDKRAQLTGKAVDPDAIQLGWTHPDIPPEKPHVEIEWNAVKWEEWKDDSSLICMYVTKVDVVQKLTISMFIANKYRPGTCPYKAILSHEMKHADGYTSATDTYLSEVKKALLKSTGIPWPSRPLIIPTSAVSQEQDRVTKVVHDTVWPLFLRLLEIFREQEVELDTPAEYARVRASCPDSDWE